VPVDEDEASESRIASSKQKASIAFTTTHWSVVLEAQGQSPAAQEALENLCRTYWRPVYSFVRRQGIRTQEAEDLTQGFFSLLLERRDFDAVRKVIARALLAYKKQGEAARVATLPKRGDFLFC
jgi:hypothetical protein